MTRWAVPLLLSLGALVGAAVLFAGYAIHVHAGICDPENCPSQSAIKLGRAMVPIGATVLAVNAVALVIRIVRDVRRRQRGRPPRRRPTLREW
jgi:hypothetical protein